MPHRQPVRPPVWLFDVDDPAFDRAPSDLVATLVHGFVLPDEPWDLAGADLVCRGVVDSTDAAYAAVVALSRGAGIRVAVALAGLAAHRFVEDVSKLGSLQPTDPAAGAESVQLSVEQAGLLASLAAGRTVTAAAADHHVSRRTANRLLADIRAALEVETTAEAVGWWVGRQARA